MLYRVLSTISKPKTTRGSLFARSPELPMLYRVLSTISKPKTKGK
jgi:hypothetical protein